MTASQPPHLRDERHNRKSDTEDEQAKLLRQIIAVFDAQLGKAPSISRLDDLPSILYRTVPPIAGSYECDLELYALLAIIFDLALRSWYGKITTDKTFIHETTNITATCLRKIVDRLALVDMKSLLLDEVPALLIDHLQGQDMLDTTKTQADDPQRSTMLVELLPRWTTRTGLLCSPFCANTQPRRMTTGSEWPLKKINT